MGVDPVTLAQNLLPFLKKDVAHAARAPHLNTNRLNEFQR
jgi:hypothetical protein